MEPNPEAIAWYVQRAENLLDDLRNSLQSLRSHGAFAIALRGALLPQAVSDISANEVANYITERFTHEPDLWRVHIRTIRGLLESIETTTRQGDKTAQAVMWAGRAFLAGLSAVGVALAILISVVSF